jgi:hypothetical protein
MTAKTADQTVSKLQQTAVQNQTAKLAGRQQGLGQKHLARILEGRDDQQQGGQTDGASRK